jgi:cell volume regulation protein A
MNPSAGPGDLLWMFVAQMGIGGAAGVLFGRAAGPAINRIHISYEGMYPILLMAAGALIYSATASVGGSGFLAVYIAGMMIGNDDIIHKKLLLRFFDSLAWLAQISMFLVLGLLVSPSELLIVLPAGLILSAVLMFVARPGAVFATLAFDAMPVREKLFVSWVGLRGAVPIILATFPLLAEVPHAGTLFALVSFVVLTSALFQGWTIPCVARLLRVDAPLERKLRLPLDFAPATTTETELLDITVPFASPVAGQQIVDLGLPSGTLVVLISRDNQYVVPAGGTVIEGGDTLVMLVNKGCIDEVRDMLTGARKG